MINAVNMSKLRSPKDPSWVAITADDDTELLAILHDGTVRGTIENAGPAAQQFVTALRGLTETIAAQAKAEALTEAAEYIDAGDLVDMNPDGTMRTRRTQVQISQRSRDVTSRWLRARAATIERKES